MSNTPPHNAENRNEIFDSSTKLFKEFHIGKLLLQCNARKMKGIPVMNIFLIDDSLFNRFRSSKTELLAKVFDSTP